MSSFHELLVCTTKELQELPSIKNFHLAGGTNLSLRYNHRNSVDIDLMSPEIISNQGFSEIVAELNKYYGDKSVITSLINEELGDKYAFLRAFIATENASIKVELIQNIKILFEPEYIYGIRLLAKEDVGMLKLMSLTSRMAKKDVYDLDYLTDEIPLEDLMNYLKEKKSKYGGTENNNVFDLDNPPDPTKNPLSLLAFDQKITYTAGRPNHSHDRLDFVDGSKSWSAARSNWRNKVRTLCNRMGVDIPNTLPLN